jgi:hypothetical protein
VSAAPFGPDTQISRAAYVFLPGLSVTVESQLLQPVVSLAVWAAEQGLGDYPHPRGSLEQFVQEHGDPYHFPPRQRVC